MKTHIKFLIRLFSNSFIKIFIIFFSIILITNTLEQAEFFKDIEFNFIYIIFLSFLNTPSIIFELLPFIFLISTQVFFISLIDKNELEIFKYSGLDNYKIIKIITTYSFFLGFLFVIIFYNLSSVLKNSFLQIKNQYTDDSKYLAVITENGLWIKDQIEEHINIINADKVDNQFLLNVDITQFDKDFNMIRIIKSKKVNISSYTWRVLEPVILENDIMSNFDKLEFVSNFDLKKINSLFSNLSSLTIIDLIKLRKNYKSLNYSLTEIDSHLYKLISYPIYLTLITVFSSIIMFNIGYQKNSLLSIVLGIFLSVVIYYVNYFLKILGTSEKIPLIVSVFLPLIILSIINMTSIIRLNEK
tara:strand:- start:4321 stop:5394 length:1074 start_codon:yes stop_codon:yes gene_type:complete